MKLGQGSAGGGGSTAAAASLVGSLLGSSGGGGGGGGGGEGSSAEAASKSSLDFKSKITVSPSIQTKISPQISPVFSQIQDSAGASTYGAPTMTSSGGQYADGGEGGGGGYPGSRRLSPFDEYGRPVDRPRYPDYGGMPMVSQMGGYSQIVKWGIMGAIALFAIKSFKKPGYGSARPGPKTVTGTRLA